MNPTSTQETGISLNRRCKFGGKPMLIISEGANSLIMLNRYLLYWGKSRMNPTSTQETGPFTSCIGNGGRPMARPWEKLKARSKVRARARASNGLMCVKEGRPNVMSIENSCCPRWDSNPQPPAFMADHLPCATGTNRYFKSDNYV